MFKKSKTSSNYVGYGSVTHSVIDSRRQQRHLVTKVLLVVFLSFIILSIFSLCGYKTIDYIQQRQTKIVNAAPRDDYSEIYGGGTATDEESEVAWQRGTVTRVPKPETVAVAADANDKATNAGIIGTACADYPLFPDELCAGTPKGVVLSQQNNLVITQNDTVINAQEITGGVTINANNVTIKNSLIRGVGTGNGITVVSGTVKIIDTEISSFENGIVGDNWRAYRTNIHSMTGNGVKIGSYVILEDSWIHNLKPLVGTVASGARIDSGVVNAIIRHNKIDLTGEANILAAIYVAPDFGPYSKGPLLIEKNLLGGGIYSLQCLDGNAGKYLIKDINIVLNHFVRTTNQGPVLVNVVVTQSDNVWDNDSSIISF